MWDVDWMLDYLDAGRPEGFLVAAGLWAVSNACIGATPAAYAADVMPRSASGLGLGIYRSAGDIGMSHSLLQSDVYPCLTTPVASSKRWACTTDKDVENHRLDDHPLLKTRTERAHECTDHSAFHFLVFECYLCFKAQFQITESLTVFWLFFATVCWMAWHDTASVHGLSFQGHVGLMVGPALLGWISDISSVQTAMTFNAAVLIIAVAIFGLTAQETRQSDPSAA